MSAGEIGHAAGVARPETASHPGRRGLSAVALSAESRAQPDDGNGRTDTTAEVAACLAEDELSPATRRAVEALLQRHRALEHEVARQRKLLQEWIVSQLTYKSLYFLYSGQSPEAPRLELVRERDAVRRRIQAQMEAGGAPGAGPLEAKPDSSRP